jgi:4-amino-4-deoxy-L-arabinose transferase-like glycosyltransferase
LKTNSHLSKKTLLIVCLLTITAFFVRIKYINTTVINHPIRADAYQYVCYGFNLAFNSIYSKDATSGKPVPDSYRSPGYPLLIALAFKLCGNKSYYPFLQYTQALLSALLVPLTFFTGMYFLSANGALISGFLVAISPHLISISSYLLTETLFGFFLLLSLYLFVGGVKKTNNCRIIFSGLFCGFAFLTNETFLFVPYILSALIIINKKTAYFLIPKISTKTILYFLMVFTLFPSAWYIRNALNIPEGVKSNRALETMIHGTYPGFIYKSEKFKYYPYREDPELYEFGSSIGSFISFLSKRVKERPLRYLVWYLLEKPYYLWSWNILQGQGDIYIYPVKTSLYQQSHVLDITRIAMKALHPVVMFSALLGIIIITSSFTKNRLFHITETAIAILIIYYTIIYTVFASWPRYSIPMRPELYLFSIWTISIVFQWHRKRFKRA